MQASTARLALESHIFVASACTKSNLFFSYESVYVNLITKQAKAPRVEDKNIFSTPAKACTVVLQCHHRPSLLLSFGFIPMVAGWLLLPGASQPQGAKGRRQKAKGAEAKGPPPQGPCLHLFGQNQVTWPALSCMGSGEVSFQE